MPNRRTRSEGDPRALRVDDWSAVRRSAVDAVVTTVLLVAAVWRALKAP
jgi:hypothetical protein